MNIQQAIATAVTTLSETFRQPLTDAAAKGYLIGLEDLTHEQVAMAMKRAIRESKFMPSPAELRAFAGASGPKAIEAAAVEAWEAVRGAVRRHGYTHGVDFGPLVNAVVRNLGGWQWLTDQTTDSMVWVRKDFERVYGLLAAAPTEGLRGDPLAGAFGGDPVRIQIGSASPPPRAALPEQRGPAADNVRQLVAGLAAKADYP